MPPSSESSVCQHPAHQPNAGGTESPGWTRGTRCEPRPSCSAASASPRMGHCGLEPAGQRHHPAVGASLSLRLTVPTPPPQPRAGQPWEQTKRSRPRPHGELWVRAHTPASPSRRAHGHSATRQQAGPPSGGPWALGGRSAGGCPLPQGPEGPRQG